MFYYNSDPNPSKLEPIVECLRMPAPGKVVE